MSIALTCDCGARFEVEDLFAEQEVSCPECQAQLRAPPRSDAPAPVSLLALYSLVLAVVGAFTLVGSVASLILAGIALFRIHRPPARGQGVGYAVAAILIAFLGAAVTIGILYHPGASALPGWFRARSVAGQLDMGVPALVGSRDGACVVTRPPGWGRLRDNRGIDPTIEFLQSKRDVILCSPRAEAYLDVQREASGIGLSLEDYCGNLLSELTVPPPALLDGDEENRFTGRQQISLTVRGEKRLDDVDGHQGVEKTADLRRGGRTWRWVVRAYRKRNPNDGKAFIVYVVRAYVPLNRFASVEKDLREALASIRFPP